MKMVINTSQKHITYLGNMLLHNYTILASTIMMNAHTCFILKYGLSCKNPCYTRSILLVLYCTTS